MPEILKVGPGDNERLAAYLSSFPNDKMSTERWLARLRSWWDDNPALTEDFTRGLMLCDGGKIVGFIGSVPLKFLSKGVETVCVAGTTWRVLPQYRGQSITLKTRQVTVFPGKIHMAGNAARMVPAVLKLLGYQTLEKWRGGDEQSVILLNPGKFIREKFKTGWLRALAPVLAPVMSVVQAFALRRLRGCDVGNVRELSQADAAFDDLWDRTRHLYQYTNVRSAAAVNWYCFTAMPEDKKLFGYYRGDRLLGYMIVWSELDGAMRVAYCVDLWLDLSADESEIAGALVSRAANWAKGRGYDRLIVPHFHRKTAALCAKLGLPRRPAWKRREFIHAPKEILSSMTRDNTYLVGALGEVGL